MIRYICEPEKNTECKKTFCQEFCKATAFKEYAKRDEYGAPIVAKDFEIIPQIKINREVFEIIGQWLSDFGMQTCDEWKDDDEKEWFSYEQTIEGVRVVAFGKYGWG